MGQKSNVDKLTPELRKKLLKLLKNPAVTQGEIVDIINTEAGEAVVSKSGVNRYAKKMNAFIEKSKQAKEIAELYMDRMGDTQNNSMGKVVNEQIRIAVFDLMQEIEEFKSNEDFNSEKLADMLYKVSRALKELEHAEKLNAEREEKIKKRILEEQVNKLEEAKDKNESIDDVIEKLRRELTGQAR